MRWDDPRRRSSDRIAWRHVAGIVRDGIVGFLLLVGFIVAASGTS